MRSRQRDLCAEIPDENVQKETKRECRKTSKELGRLRKEAGGKSKRVRKPDG